MKYWTTNNGTRIAIKDMTDNHLNNAIKMLKRSLQTRPEEAYYTGTSDYGDEWVEMENRFNEQLAERINNSVKTLEAEAKKRNLVLQ